MSLHALPSPEAERTLRFQKRLSTVSSILVSLLIIVLVGLFLAFILMPFLIVESPIDRDTGSKRVLSRSAPFGKLPSAAGAGWYLQGLATGQEIRQSTELRP